MEITTERCQLRPFMEMDLKEWTTYRNNAEWMRFQGFKGLSLAEYRKVLLAAPDEEHGVQLAIVSRAAGQLIGDLYYRLEGDACWLGYTVAPAFARQGYAAEAARALLGQVARRGFHRALADVSPDNAASIALLSRLGFCSAGQTPDGDLLYERSLDDFRLSAVSSHKKQY